MERIEAGRFLCDFLSGKKIPEARLKKLSLADWESLVVLARRFKVGGLFYREIKSTNFLDEFIPADVRNRLRDEYRNRATINTSIFFEASKVIRFFDDNQLPVIALKGLALAKSIYGDIALRPMSDLDLLVKEEDLVKAGRILLTLGYNQCSPAWESTTKTLHHHLPSFRNKNGVSIELHWNIVDLNSSIKVDLDGLWERACFIKVDNLDVRVFSPEDLFLHLCIHACGHLQSGIDLIPLCDLAGLIKTSADQIDWQIVNQRAIGWGGQKCVYLMLLLVRELLGALLSDKIMSAIKPSDYQPVFFEEALEQIFDLSPDILSNVVYREISESGQLIAITVGQLSNIKKIKGVKGKVLALLKKAFPPKEYLIRFYPVSVSSPKIYLYYLFRLGHLTVYYTLVLLRLFRRDQSVIKAVHRAQRVTAVSDWMFS